MLTLLLLGVALIVGGEIGWRLVRPVVHRRRQAAFDRDRARVNANWDKWLAKRDADREES